MTLTCALRPVEDFIICCMETKLIVMMHARQRHFVTPNLNNVVTKGTKTTGLINAVPYHWTWLL